jgi:hypothetical protein
LTLLKSKENVKKKLVSDRNNGNEQLKSSNNHGVIKFYYGIRNNLLVKLDKDMQEDGIDVT